MCLGIPAKVIELSDADMGKVDYQGTKIKTSFALVSDIKVGDWVILHAGYAISKLNEQEARQTLQLFEDIIRAEQQTED